MPIELDTLIMEAGKLSLVPLVGITAYRNMMGELTRYVDETLSQHHSLDDLLGANDPQLMSANHRHHASFMLTVFSLGNYALLARTLPWVYRVYFSQNFSYDYFKVELQAWLAGLHKFLNPAHATEIICIYIWILDKHDQIIQLSQEHNKMHIPVSPNWLIKKHDFLTALLEGNRRQCLNIAEQSVANAADLREFYLQIIQPAMYEIGMMWENGVISTRVSHEAIS